MAAEAVKAMFPKIDTKGQLDIDVFTYAEIGLAGLGVVAPIIMKGAYSPHIFDVVYAAMYGNSVSDSTAETERRIETAEKITNVSWYVVAILIGIGIVYLGHKTGKEGAKYAAIPLILANAAYMFVELKK